MPEFVLEESVYNPLANRTLIGLSSHPHPSAVDYRCSDESFSLDAGVIRETARLFSIRLSIAEVVLSLVKFIPGARLLVFRKMLGEKLKLRQHFVGTGVVEV
jgi:hypothetical protein